MSEDAKEYRFFDRDSVKRFRRVVHKECRRMRVLPTEPEYDVVMVLSCIYAFGTDVAVLSEVSGHSQEFVRSVLRRARQQRILKGQTLRADWNGEYGSFALMLDAMVGSGALARPVDEKLSAIRKARPRGKDTKPRKQRTKMAEGTVFTPKVRAVDPLYGLAEWEKKQP